MINDDMCVKTDPSKSFFIDMLTRDIGTKECILDLIDNSIDSIIKYKKIEITTLVAEGFIKDVIFKKHSIDIILNKNEFIIKDNCYGISLIDARQKAFRFGAVKENIKEKKGLSVYGIGMKRAFFKLGKKINVISKTKQSFFEIDIDVDSWESDDKNWDFVFSSYNEKSNSSTGTEIKINKINTDLIERASNSIFIEELSRLIAKTFSLYLDAGLSITINGKKLKSNFPEFLFSDILNVTRKKYTITSSTNSEVNLLIIAGLTGKTERDYKGWFVFCNGRLILPGNTDYKTGWGQNFPAFHNKYNHFVGFLHIISNDGHALPWTTTKEDIEIESSVYQNAIEKAKLIAKPFTDFLNSEYAKRDSSDNDEPDIFQNTTTVNYKDIPITENIVKSIKKDKIKNEFTTITYRKSISDLNKIKNIMGNDSISNKEIGERTFDYYITMEEK